MHANELALLRGMDATRATLARWNAAPGPVLRRWSAASLAVAVLLLVAVWLVATLATPDPTRQAIAGLTRTPDLEDVARVLTRNALVLALHGFACVAGYLAGSALPHEALRRRGLWRRVHDVAGPLAIVFVTGATLFSLTTQAYILGNVAATLAAQLDASPALFMLGLLPHALLELWALFLPLAAWLIASRSGDWHELLAATAVTVAIATPALVISSLVEVYASPHLVGALTGYYTL
jgi:hypothetical protein